MTMLRKGQMTRDASKRTDRGRLYNLAWQCRRRLPLPDFSSYFAKPDRMVQRKEPRKNTMETEFVTLNRVPVRVDFWGGVSPTKLQENPEVKPEELVLIVPGNPGVTKFYHRFGRRLSELTKTPIWLVSHGGHDRGRGGVRCPSLRRNKGLYTLEGQVAQKRDLVQRYLQGVRLHCVGHSIGCRMILEAMSAQDNIESAFLLFPTIERMADTPNGRFISLVNRYALWLLVLLSYVFVYLPRLLQIPVVRTICFFGRMSPSNMGSLIELFDPHVVRNVLFLAHDEMRTVLERDDAALARHCSKLRLYYGAADGWVPLDYFQDLKAKHPGVKAEVCARSYSHAFVLENSLPVAEMVAEWLQAK